MKMQKWQWISLILCTFGLFKELRPSEPFITQYITDFKNVTAKELIHIAFPVSTYSSLASIAVVFLVTDFLRYRPVVIFEALAYVVTWTILIFGQDLTCIIFVEIFYGIACSTEVAYYTYIYAQVDKKHYAKVTSNTSSALYVGKFLGGLLAQGLVSYKLMNFHELTYLTLFCSILGLCATLFLPSVKSSIYFHRSNDSNEDEENQKFLLVSTKDKIRLAWDHLWGDFKEAYTNGYILKWSVWWALASAGQYQVVNYIQSLWERINEDAETPLEPFNGAVKAIHTLLSAVISLGVGYVRVPWDKWGESFLSSVSLLQGAMLVWMSETTHLYAAYFSYIIFRTMHPMMMTIASAEVAQGISKDSHGLVFGMNTFIALIMQTVLTLVVSDKNGFAFDERTQFFIYGVCFMILGILFFIAFIYSVVISFNNPSLNQNASRKSKVNTTSDNNSPITTTFIKELSDCNGVLLEVKSEQDL